MLGQCLLDAGGEIHLAAAAQVDGQLQAGHRNRDHRVRCRARITGRLALAVAGRPVGEHRPAPDRLGEAAAVLDPVADDLEPGQIHGRGAERLEDRSERGRQVQRARAAQPGDRSDVNLHGGSGHWLASSLTRPASLVRAYVFYADPCPVPISACTSVSVPDAMAAALALPSRSTPRR